MSGQLQFGGTVPFTDRASGQQVMVRVWGVYAGHGVDAHEEQAIQQWIMNALATSAASYEGNVYELPAKAQEWGNWVSQQIAPGLAQQFQAQGQIHIQGVQIEGQGGGKGAAMGAPMAKQAPMGGGKADMAAQALMQQLGMPQDQAYQAASIVLGVAAGGAAGMAKGAPMQQPGMDPYKAKQQKMGGDPYAKGGDPYAKKGADPYAQKGAAHDPYAKKGADPYAQKAQKAADPYAHKAQKGADPYAQKAQKGAPHDPYAKKGADPAKGDPYKKKGY